MDTNAYEDLCSICDREIQASEASSILRQKGADGINAASTNRGDNIVVTAGRKVHIDCRKRYTNPIDIQLKKNREESGSCVTRKRSARILDGNFDSKTDRLFCGTRVLTNRPGFSFVKTDVFARTILECCERRSDDWSFAVKGRIEYYGGDLHAADCLYHHSCSVNFRYGFNVPLQ